MAGTRCTRPTHLVQLARVAAIEAGHRGAARAGRHPHLKFHIIRQDDGPAAAREGAGQVGVCRVWCGGARGRSDRGAGAGARHEGHATAGARAGRPRRASPWPRIQPSHNHSTLAHRKLSEWGQMGVNSMAGTEGCAMEPPAATLYAVDPAAAVGRGGRRLAGWRWGGEGAPACAQPPLEAQLPPKQVPSDRH